jgi:hypothetical protein
MTSSPRFVTAARVALFLSACTTGMMTPEPNGEGGSTGGKKGGSGGGTKSGGSGGNGTSGSGGVVSGGGSGDPGSGGSGGGSVPDASTDMIATDGGTDGGSDCGASTTLLCTPLRKMPKTLKETGLFPAAPDFSMHDARMRSFVPNPPLWSDGMEKERFMLLPVGKKIDNTNPKVWVFPVGTIFIKTFFDDRPLAGAKLRPIETRIIRRVGNADDLVEYDYFLYKWN